MDYMKDVYKRQEDNSVSITLNLILACLTISLRFSVLLHFVEKYLPKYEITSTTLPVLNYLPTSLSRSTLNFCLSFSQSRPHLLKLRYILSVFICKSSLLRVNVAISIANHNMFTFPSVFNSSYDTCLLYTSRCV